MSYIICLCSITVRLGDGDLEDRKGIQFRAIEKRAIHPRYVGAKRAPLGSPYFDVAVLTLDKKVDISGSYVRPICLPESASDNIDKYEGDQVDVAGELPLRSNYSTVCI